MWAEPPRYFSKAGEIQRTSVLAAIVTESTNHGEKGFSKNAYWLRFSSGHLGVRAAMKGFLLGRSVKTLANSKPLGCKVLD
jgi:hypothetical protein